MNLPTVTGTCFSLDRKHRLYRRNYSTTDVDYTNVGYPFKNCALSR